MSISTNNEVSFTTKLKKYVELLRGPAKKTKTVIENALKNSEKRFQEQAKVSDTNEQKPLLSTKLDKIRNELKTLKSLSEDEIILFALTTKKKVMAIAANQRMPKDMRMKARIASHKPLSTHLAKVKRKVDTSQPLEEESNEEEEEIPDNIPRTLDQITFNNQIVLMRSGVRRAKVHIIHKLTRQLQNLRKKCARGGEKKDKFEKKVQQLVKKIKYIKELEADDISKFALSTTLNLNKVCSEVKIPMKTQAMASVALHKFTLVLVEDFKKKFPDWKKTVPPLLKKRNKRKLNIEVVKTKKDAMKKPLKEQSKGFSQESENIGSDSDGNSMNSGSDSERKENNMSDEEECDKPVESDENEESSENEEESGNIGNNSENEADSEEVEIEEKKKTKPNEEERKQNFVVKRQNVPKSSFKKTVKENVKSRNVFTVEDSGNANLSKVKTFKPKVEAKPKVVDPFFMTTTNEEYVTSQVPVNIDGNQLSWKSIDEDFSQNKTNSFINIDKKRKWDSPQDQNRFGNHKGKQHKPFVNHFEKALSKPVLPLGNLGNRKERRKAMQQPTQMETTEKLHPSWEAKKKQTMMATFQGKKITFD